MLLFAPGSGVMLEPPSSPGCSKVVPKVIPLLFSLLDIFRQLKAVIDIG
jgi:hypothetical protein